MTDSGREGAGARSSETDRDRRRAVLSRAALVLASELSLPAVLQRIADLACEVADARYGALGVLGPDRRIEEFVTSGITEDERRSIGTPPHGMGILGVIIDEARPVRLDDLSTDPRASGYPKSHPKMGSFLGVPIAIRGRVFGNLYLTDKRGAKGFTSEDEEAVVELATHAALAVEITRLYEQAQIGQRRLQAVNEIAGLILEGKATDDVLRLIARDARMLVGARFATIATPRGDDKLTIRVADGDHAGELEGAVFEAESSISGEVMRSGRPVLLTDASTDPRVHQPLVSLGEIGPALLVPLAVGDRTFGTLAVGNHPEDARFSSDDLSVLETFASQAAVALEHGRIRDELHRLALIEDRERIAKELHDDVIQSLFAEGMALQASLAMVNDPEAMEARVTQSVERIDQVIRDLRNYIFGLRPGIVADRQIERSLRELASRFAEGSDAEIDVIADTAAASRLASRAGDVIQAAREAISNAVRHSGAGHVTVRLMEAGDSAVLEISDDGAGFAPEDAAGRGHGLANLRLRAHAMGGELDIESELGKGTWVRIRMPM